MSATDKLYVSLLSIWVILSVGSNMSVIGCIWKTSRDRQTAGRRSLTSTDILLISLALNDILLAGIVLPQKIHDISHTGDFFERKSLNVFTFYQLTRASLSHVDFSMNGMFLAVSCELK